ncbi:hypothetical protein NEOLI_004793 [Neolecta irregularis DAH-3]|uniref:Uncharacterized protein n=1 Tax=Neolecta irregularis (strain DAH-3) TaxID=1198029 RepID=A0A1U7LRS3_NEOID|nr:hypothetical protein NEOLI_004793 [Neolecta irregularis DAH-3]|eukprot:OLL25344.1 hypothetical protein NEOLI_004793 [Neolecta irregularis DAH-3]
MEWTALKPTPEYLLQMCNIPLPELSLIQQLPIFPPDSTPKSLLPYLSPITRHRVELLSLGQASWTNAISWLPPEYGSGIASHLSQLKRKDIDTAQFFGFQKPDQDTLFASYRIDGLNFVFLWVVDDDDQGCPAAWKLHNIISTTHEDISQWFGKLEDARMAFERQKAIPSTSTVVNLCRKLQ